MAYRVFREQPGLVAGQGSAYMLDPLDVGEFGRAMRAKSTAERQAQQAVEDALEFENEGWGEIDAPADQQAAFLKQQYQYLAANGQLTPEKRQQIMDQANSLGLAYEQTLNFEEQYNNKKDDAKKTATENVGFDINAYTAYNNQKNKELQELYKHNGYFPNQNPYANISDGRWWSTEKEVRDIVKNLPSVSTEDVEETGGYEFESGESVKVDGKIAVKDPKTGKVLYGLQEVKNGKANINWGLVENFHKQLPQGARNDLANKAMSSFEAKIQDAQKQINEGGDIPQWARPYLKDIEYKEDAAPSIIKSAKLDKQKMVSDFTNGDLAIPYQTTVPYEGEFQQEDENGNLKTFEGTYDYETLQEAKLAEILHYEDKRSIKNKETSAVTSQERARGFGQQKSLSRITANNFAPTPLVTNEGKGFNNITGAGVAVNLGTDLELGGLNVSVLTTGKENKFVQDANASRWIVPESARITYMPYNERENKYLPVQTVNNLLNESERDDAYGEIVDFVANAGGYEYKPFVHVQRIDDAKIDDIADTIKKGQGELAEIEKTKLKKMLSEAFYTTTDQSVSGKAKALEKMGLSEETAKELSKKDTYEYGYVRLDEISGEMASKLGVQTEEFVKEVEKKGEIGFKNNAGISINQLNAIGTGDADYQAQEGDNTLPEDPTNF